MTDLRPTPAQRRTIVAAARTDALVDEGLCIYCETNPAEPGLPCCDNAVCKDEYVKDKQGSEAR